MRFDLIHFLYNKKDFPTCLARIIPAFSLSLLATSPVDIIEDVRHGSYGRTPYALLKSLFHIQSLHNRCSNRCLVDEVDTEKMQYQAADNVVGKCSVNHLLAQRL